MTDAPSTKHDPGQDLELARRAADGDPAARRRVNELAHPMIRYQSGQFCPRFCHDNLRHFQCTLPDRPPPGRGDTPLCEWGNASYGWMLDELTRPARLRRFKARDGASLGSYFFQIANSLPFYERWKDWRLGRRAHVPTYLQDLSPHAAAIFHALRRGDTVALIAQQLGLAETTVDHIVQQMVITLTRRQRLHLLDPPREVSLQAGGGATDDDDAPMEMDIACEDLAPEERDARQRVQRAWAQLDATEQFVLEAMLIDGQDADAVLAALKQLNIALNERVPAADTDRQQLYYFRRKAVAKLARLSRLD